MEGSTRQGGRQRVGEAQPRLPERSAACAGRRVTPKEALPEGEFTLGAPPPGKETRTQGTIDEAIETTAKREQIEASKPKAPVAPKESTSERVARQDREEQARRDEQAKAWLARHDEDVYTSDTLGKSIAEHVSADAEKAHRSAPQYSELREAYAESIRQGYQLTFHQFAIDASGAPTCVPWEPSGVGAGARGAEPASGQPYKATLYQGRGASLEKVYGKEAVAQGRAVPLLGPGRYYAPTRKDAETFGTVTEHEVELQNPLVIDSDTKWNAVVSAAGAGALRNLGEHIAKGEGAKIVEATERINKWAREQGHDGIVVSNITWEHDETKSLRRLAAHNQVVVFEQKPKVPVAEKTVGELQSEMEAKTKIAVGTLEAKKQAAKAKLAAGPTAEEDAIIKRLQASRKARQKMPPVPEDEPLGMAVEDDADLWRW
jgi:hypothetical protein